MLLGREGRKDGGMGGGCNQGCKGKGMALGRPPPQYIEKGVAEKKSVIVLLNSV